MDWTEKKREEAEKTLTKWRNFSKGVEASLPPKEFEDIIADDLNTAGAITILHRVFGLLEADEAGAELPDFDSCKEASAFVAAANMLGLLTDELDGWWGSNFDFSTFVVLLGKLRVEAMQTKDFSKLDAMKKGLSVAGADVRMSKDKIEVVANPDFDESKLTDLLWPNWLNK